jgi:hypothetical protein
MYYWAAYIGPLGAKLVDLFLKDLGFSPFIGFYRGLSPIVGAIKNQQLDVFNYLVENSRYNLNTEHNFEGEKRGTAVEVQGVLGSDRYYFPEKPKGVNKYYFPDEASKLAFETGRQSTDSIGNNILHHIFHIKEPKKLRDQFL